MSTAAPAFGLVLAGGASTRMQRDKAALSYHGQSQLQWTYELLSDLCAATFVSVRPDQRDEPVRSGFPQIVDRQPGAGPIAGITAAMAQHPKAAWLVVACDLPFLTRETLEHLLANRDPQKSATAYRSAHDGLPEPLCAIWEPSAREPLFAYFAGGKQCPRKFLINSDARLLDLPEARALDNVNTGAEHTQALATLHAGAGDGAQNADPKPASSAARASTPRTLKIQYFALFREQAGRSEESVETTAATPTELYRELQARYPFKLAREQLKVAINTEFSDWNAPLRNGDTIVFIPPVAGG